jgi:hypothetical protein
MAELENRYEKEFREASERQERLVRAQEGHTEAAQTLARLQKEEVELLKPRRQIAIERESKEHDARMAELAHVRVWREREIIALERIANVLEKLSREE